ncbi:glycosyltransferase family 4 protein [Alloyangia pacifica]|uniref:glycosyltransferase family 4 protein n=1 Tax=Alloyangia pacifica TaxID=311180 RepID=UPI001CD7A604|nr:glycosyltransferase family 4 protein [Alloyangia pacifica]MCA0998658.1 glycosyltransferase family 4 protein [Alloyangia pacifica]
MRPRDLPLIAKLRATARRMLKGPPPPPDAHQYHGAFRGSVDPLSETGVVRGWVIRRDSQKGRVPVAIYAGARLLDARIADEIREDVRIATGGTATCGFQFGLSDSQRQQIAAAGGDLRVRTEGPDGVELARLHLPSAEVDPGPGADMMTRCRAVLQHEIAALQALLDDTPLHAASGAEPLPQPEPELRRHALLFDTAPLIPEVPASGQPAYLDYMRFRYRLDGAYPMQPGDDSQEQFLYWYLTAYRSQEHRRTPLAAAQIAHLNAPITMGGQSHSLSRAMWWRLMGRPDLLGRLDLNDRDAYLDLLFWWAHQDVAALYFEDCLVPEHMAQALRDLPGQAAKEDAKEDTGQNTGAFPASQFVRRFHAENPKLHFLDLARAEHRRTLALVLLLQAAQRPDLLRYMPQAQIDALLAPDPATTTGASALETFVAALTGADTSDAQSPAQPSRQPLSLPRARYAAALRQRYFDLDSRSFRNFDRAGNRLEAAAMALPAPDREEVDVQLIGPLAKTSGLGQATRLSASILRQTGLRVRGVDFDLDNPAPEGFSSETLIEDYGPAKINLIHLNAESTPLAFAYQPDVFSNAYNIGYFYWELDRPAYCHYLGMELLDEIWVSSAYGLHAYKPDAKGTPVVNVGMCYEEHPDITRAAARDFVNARFGFDDSHYVCLFAFDSYSFVQRKNPVAVLEAFQQAFEGMPDARLVVKTQNREDVFDPMQAGLWARVDELMQNDPRIVVLNETLSYRDLLQLKAGADCYISLHKSEGWGFGMIEAMALKVPVVCTAYSGNMEFCSEATAWLVDYEETELRQGDYIFVRPGSLWAEPSVSDAARQLRAAYDDPEARAAKVEAAYSHIRENFSTAPIARRYSERLRQILADLPERR